MPEQKTPLPDIPRVNKAVLGHALNDFMDMSIHEYSTQYISHSKCSFDGAFVDLMDEIKGRLVKFFKSSSRELNFYVWNEVANGFTVILSQIFPPCLNKYLADYYKYHLKKYAKERIKKEKKLYDRKTVKEETRK